jgi:hypothetical protein
MIMKNLFDHAASCEALRPSLRTVPTVTIGYRSQWRRLMRGEVQWSITGEAEVVRGGTGARRAPAPQADRFS